MLLAITLLLDGEHLVTSARRLVPESRRPAADRFGALVYQVIGKYIAGSVFVAALAGVVILIAALTSQKTERVYPFEVLVEPPEGGLTRRSKILLMQLRAVDKRRVRGRYGTVSDATLRRVEDALKVATGLTKM